MRPEREQELFEVAGERAEATGRLVAVAAFANGESYAVFDSPEKPGGDVINVRFARDLLEIAAEDDDIVVAEQERPS
jgi:hypothetical protein